MNGSAFEFTLELLFLLCGIILKIYIIMLKIAEIVANVKNIQIGARRDHIVNK